jgi:hypothetical protein
MERQRRQHDFKCGLKRYRRNIGGAAHHLAWYFRPGASVVEVKSHGAARSRRHRSADFTMSRTFRAAILKSEWRIPHINFTTQAFGCSYTVTKVVSGECAMRDFVSAAINLWCSLTRITVRPDQLEVKKGSSVSAQVITIVSRACGCPLFVIR